MLNVGYAITSLLIALCVLSVIGLIYLANIDKVGNDYVIGEQINGGGNQVANTCDDDDSCTIDIRLGDRSCIHRKYETGHDCSVGEVCYNSSAPSKKCCGNGKCIAERKYCNAICPTAGFFSNASVCNFGMFPMNYQQFSVYSLYCIYGTCTLTVIYYSDELNALDDSYLFNASSCPKNNNYALSKCIQRHCVLHPSNVWVCTFRYRCALFDYGNNLIDGNSVQISNVDEKNETIYSSPSFGQYIPPNIKNEMNLAYTKIVKDLLEKASKQAGKV